ncbi:MAG: hypothetical protein ABIV63_03415 [Caldimonas sp.]
MDLNDTIANPFALLMTPEAVFAAVDKSDRLRSLASRTCRPLDERQARKEFADARATSNGGSGVQPGDLAN